MKKLFPVIIFLAVVQLAQAQRQGEQLFPLQINPSLYYSVPNRPNPNGDLRSLVTGGNYIIVTDTLQLPFIDDFSSNQEPPYKWYETHVIDSFTNVVGGCLASLGLGVLEDTFSLVPTFQYYLDTAYQEMDSFAKPPIIFTFFSASSYGCLNGTPQTVLLWPVPYIYLFDSAGQAVDSVKDYGDGDTGVAYLPKLYFAQAEENSLWIDNYAYINSTFPINPPTIGVATLDGFNQYGEPYDTSGNSGGQADYLTSKPIDLSALSPTDSVYLSFFFEGGGMGDYPDVADSLILEFADESGNWNQVWYDTGYSDPSLVPDTFQQVLVPVLLPHAGVPFTYYYNTFQFRFRNVVTQYGSNNLWHIDYVKLDKNRFYNDTVIHDMSFIYPFPTILKNYTQLPASQYVDSTDLADTINLLVRNLDPDAYTNPPATDFVTQANELYPLPRVVSAPPTETFNAGPYNNIQILPSQQYKIGVDTNVDSMVVTSEVYTNANVLLTQHDTLHHTQSFTSVMAYDDGSAETAYGLTGLGWKKFAYEFNLIKPDTLQGFQFMFTQVSADVSDLLFNFDIWDTLQLHNYLFMDTPVQQLFNQFPYYIDSINGYATYLLDSPIIVNNKIYIGWDQQDENPLQVGFDRNSTLGYKHMFAYLNGEWDSTSVPDTGSVMIRAIFTSTPWWGRTSSTAAVNNLSPAGNTLSLFPNPTTGMLNIRSSRYGAMYNVYIESMLGQQVLQQQGVTSQLDISQLANDVYIFTARDIQTGEVFRLKIVKTSN